MIKELKSFSPCEIMSCSRQHHKMSPDTPRPQRAAPHCRPLTGKGCPRSSALPEDPAGRTGRAGSGRSSAGGRESSSTAAVPPWTFIGGWWGREGRLQQSRELSCTLTARGRPQASREPWPRGRSFYKSLRLGVVALCSAREAGDPFRCKPRHVKGFRPRFCFLRN